MREQSLPRRLQRHLRRRCHFERVNSTCHRDRHLQIEHLPGLRCHTVAFGARHARMVLAVFCHNRIERYRALPQSHACFDVAGLLELFGIVAPHVNTRPKDSGGNAHRQANCPAVPVIHVCRSHQSSVLARGCSRARTSSNAGWIDQTVQNRGSRLTPRFPQIRGQLSSFRTRSVRTFGDPLNAVVIYRSMTEHQILLHLPVIFSLVKPL